MYNVHSFHSASHDWMLVAISGTSQPLTHLLILKSFEHLSYIQPHDWLQL